MSSIAWRGEARAKVNLRLSVLARESSGFHQIETVFQALELADEIALRIADAGGIELELAGVAPDALGPVEENLAVRAAELFLSKAPAPGPGRPGVRIYLEKRVPHGAGLGGGSSDAATVLRGLNELMGEPFTLPELMSFGGRLGADVPFFVSGSVRALGWGRGDRIVPLEPLPDRPVLLIVPTEPISTAWAYSALAAHRDGTGWRPARRPRPHRPEEDWSEAESAAHNDFEEVLFSLRPDLAQIKSALQTSGARLALLSGSGSAVFGVFETEASMVAAERAVADRVAEARTIRTRTRS